MKLKFIYTLFGTLFMACLLMSNSFGRAEAFGWGNTGAPGDETLPNGNPRTCMSCHATGTDFQVTLDIDIINNDGESVTTYIPNELYTCRVTINHVSGTDPMGYGFQIVNLFDADDADVNSFSAPDDNVKLAFASNTGKNYAEHNGVSPTNQFHVMWVAPQSGSGSVTFYSCGNGINGGGTTGGDAAACNTLTLIEDGTISTADLELNNSISIFPNPANDLLNIENKNSKSTFNQLTVFDQVGQVVFSTTNSFQQNEVIQLDLSRFHSGVHQIILENEEERVVKRFVVVR